MSRPHPYSSTSAHTAPNLSLDRRPFALDTLSRYLRIPHTLPHCSALACIIPIYRDNRLLKPFSSIFGPRKTTPKSSAQLLRPPPRVPHPSHSLTARWMGNRAPHPATTSLRPNRRGPASEQRASAARSAEPPASRTLHAIPPHAWCHSERTGPRAFFSSGVVSEESAVRRRIPAPKMGAPSIAQPHCAMDGRPSPSPRRDRTDPCLTQPVSAADPPA